MISTLRQLQDLKEWSQDSTRYERRLNFRLASKPYNWEEGDWWDLDDQSVGNTKILEDFEITDEMRRRPNAEGGVQQLVQPGPGRQGYAGNTWIEEGIYQMPNKKYKIEIKRKSGNLMRTVDKLEDARKLKFDFLKTSTKEVPGKGVVKTKLPMAELKKATKHFFEIGDFTTSNYKDLNSVEQAKVQQRVRQGEGKFKKKTIHDALSKTNQEKILRYFPDAVFTKDQKWGFPRQSKKFYNVIDFAQRDYKWKHSILPESVQKDLITKFGKEVKDWDFKNNQYGAKPSEVGTALYQRLKTFVNEPTPWKYSFQLDEPGGWMLAQMDRAYKHGIRLEDGRLAYEPIKNKAGKIVGFTDNTKYGGGGRYVYSKQYLDKGAKLIDDHVDFKNTKKFVDIAKHGKMKPNKVITDLLIKGGIEVDGRLTLSHLLNHMSGVVGPKRTWNALNIHHTQKVGARATGDYQILTNVLNKRAETIAGQIKNKNFTNVPELKESGIRIVVDGKAYGASKESAKAGLARVEKMAESAVRKWGPKEFNKFRKFIKENPKLATQAGMRLNSGIPIDEIMKMPGMKKAMPWIKGEGYFALADMLNNWSKGQSFWKGAGKGVEMATFGLVDFDTDEKALLMHAVKRGIPDNEIKAMLDYLKYKKEEKRLTGLDTQLAYLEHYEDIGGEISPSKLGYAGQEGYKYGEKERIMKAIEDSEQNLEKLYNEYYAGDNRSATIGMTTLQNMMESLTAEEWNKTAGIPGIDRGYREMIGAKADEGLVWGPLFGGGMREVFEGLGFGETDSLKAFKPQELMMEHPVYGYKEQIKDMESRGMSPMEDIRMHFDYAIPSYFEGGLASLKPRRPNAIPPASGPMPQGGGLSSQFNRVRKLTG